MRAVICDGNLQRLLVYEAQSLRRYGECRFIVNLAQNYASMRRLSEVAPTLLTKTTLLWDMQKDRLLVPAEYLLIMGIPFYKEGRMQHHRSCVELALLRGQLSANTLRFFCGNGMHLASVGNVLLFMLSMAVPLSPQ